MKKGILLVFLSLILVMALVVACAPAPAPTPAPAPKPVPAPAPAPPPKTVQWKLQSFQPAVQERYSVSVVELCNRIEKATEGRVKITPYPSGALVPDGELITALGNNVIQGSNLAGAITAGVLPVSVVEYGLPMSYDNAQDTWTLFWDKGLENVLEESYNKLKIHYLVHQPPLLPVVQMTSRPIRSLSDMKAMKVRAIGALATWYAKIGASPVSMPMGEMYMALKLGTVDGGATGLDVHYSFKHQEVCKYAMTPNPIDMTPLNILVNLDAWNELSAADKATVTKVARDWSKWSVEVWDPPLAKKTRDGLMEAGVQWIEMPADDVVKMKAAAIEVWDEFAAKDPASAKAVAILKDYYRAKGKIK